MTQAQEQHNVPVLAGVAVGTGIVGAIAGLSLLAWRRHQRNHSPGRMLYSAVQKGLNTAMKDLNKRLAQLG